jgi:hypothetical protein
MALQHVNVKLSEPEARRYADMNGVFQDLQWVGAVCRKALLLTENPRFVLSDVEPLHVAVVVRYGRCFKGGRRDKFRVPVEWIDGLPPGLRTTHRDVLAVRDKHFAHSANDWELNAAMAQLAVDRETGTARLIGINPSHSRVATLSSIQIEALRDLAQRIGDQVDNEMKQEGVVLLELARRIPMDELVRRLQDPPDIPGRRHPSKDRPR